MVYKRYIKKGGKVYGPYVYHSHKKDGKVVSRYLGRHKDHKKHRKNLIVKKVLTFTLLIFVLIVGIFVMNNFVKNILFAPGEKFVLSMDNVYVPGQELNGSVKINLKKGEFIPLSTRVLIDNSGEESEFLLGDLVSLENDSVIDGNFYVEDTKISGFGQGYGRTGEKIVYPEVSFVMKITKITGKPAPKGSAKDKLTPEPETPVEPVPRSEENATEEPAPVTEENITEEPTPSGPSEEPETQIPTPIPQPPEPESPAVEEPTPEPSTPETTTETPTETQSEPPSTEPAQESTPESSSESEQVKETEPEPAPETPSKDSSESEVLESPPEVIIQEVVTGESPFILNLAGNEVAEIVSSTQEVSLVIENKTAIVTTDYFEKEQGFGQAYLVDEIVELNVDLALVTLPAKQGNFAVSLVYENEEIAFLSEPIIVSENITLTEENITFPENVTVPENATEANVTETNITGINATNVSGLVQYSAVIGQPVKWAQKVKPDKTGVAKVEIPKQSLNLRVYEVDENEGKQEIHEDASEEKNSEQEDEAGLDSITGKVITSPNITSNQTNNSTNATTITSNQTNNSTNATTPLPVASNQTNSSFNVNDLGNTKEVVIGGKGLEYEVVYETPAPYTLEQEIKNGRRVKVVGSEGIHYENVLAFTNLPETLNLQNPFGVQIRWLEQNKILSPVSVQDLDVNGIYDYVEWIVPSLSNQTFDIILITKAGHLDSNRTFISDIYEEVKELDGNWSETIPDGDYVRVTFEKNLTSGNDITIYPRTVAGTPKIEIYEVDGVDLIAEFTSIIDGESNKVFLDNLNNSQDTFDLRVLNGDVQFDHIIDPSSCSLPGTLTIIENNTENITMELQNCFRASFKKPKNENYLVRTPRSLMFNLNVWNGSSYSLNHIWTRNDSDRSNGFLEHLDWWKNNPDRLPSDGWRVFSWIQGVNISYELVVDTPQMKIIRFNGTESDNNMKWENIWIMRSDWDFVRAYHKKTYVDGSFGTQDQIAWFWDDVAFTSAGGDKVFITNETGDKFEESLGVSSFKIAYWNLFTSTDLGLANRFPFLSHYDVQTNTSSGIIALYTENPLMSKTMDWSFDTHDVVTAHSTEPQIHWMGVSGSIRNPGEEAVFDNFLFAGQGEGRDNITASEWFSPAYKSREVSSEVRAGERLVDTVNSAGLWSVYVKLFNGFSIGGGTTDKNWAIYPLSYGSKEGADDARPENFETMQVFETNVRVINTSDITFVKSQGDSSDAVIYNSDNLSWVNDVFNVVSSGFDGNLNYSVYNDSDKLVVFANVNIGAINAKEIFVELNYTGNYGIDFYKNVDIVKLNQTTYDFRWRDSALGEVGTLVYGIENVVNITDTGKELRVYLLNDSVGHNSETFNITFAVWNHEGNKTLNDITGLHEKAPITYNQHYIKINKTDDRFGILEFGESAIINETYIENSNLTLTFWGLNNTIQNYTFYYNVAGRTINNVTADGVQIPWSYKYGLKELTFNVDYAGDDIKEIIVNETNFVNSLPTHTEPAILPSPAFTTDNIVCINQSTSDIDGDKVTNIYNWFVDGNSISVLNLPFDTNISDATSNAVRDYSAFMNNGTLGGGVSGNVPIWNSTGMIGGAYDFDGVDDFIDLGSDSSLDVLANNGNFSFETWIYSDNYQKNYQMIMTKTFGDLDGAQLRFLSTTSKIQFCPEVGDSGTRANCALSNALANNNWYHVVGVYDGVNAVIYINGTKEDSINPSTNPNSNIHSVYVGKRNDGFNFDGFVDNVRIYNRSLSAEQVNNLYLEGLNKHMNSTIVSQETIEGESWTCEVTPNDAISDGIMKSNLTIVGNDLFLGIEFVFPTPQNKIFNTNTSAEINVSITESTLEEFTYNWNKTNYTFYNDSLVLMMNFDNVSSLGENDTYVKDLSNYGNDGVVSGPNPPIWNSSGKYGGAYTFFGPASFGGAINISVNGFPMPNAPQTISVWARYPSVPSGVQDIVDMGNVGASSSVQLGFRDGDAMVYKFGGIALVNASFAPSSNAWHHYVYTFNKSTHILYIDGNQSAVNSSVSPSTAVLSDASIGRWIDGVSAGWKGEIDEVRIYNRTLSFDEVQLLYNSNLNKYDLDKWSLYVNQSNLTEGAMYTYFAFAKDTFGNKNQTETRTLTVDTINPLIDFVPPTLPNNSIISDNSTEINISATEANLGEFTYNWNRTNYTFYDDSLVFMMNFDNVSSLGENDTYVKDLSNYGNDGDCQGANCPVWNSSGKYGGAYDFKGAVQSNYIDAGSFDIVGNQMTISAWINPRSFAQVNNGDSRIISKAIGTANSDHWWMLSTIDSTVPGICPNPVTGEVRLRFRLKTDLGGTKFLCAGSGNVSLNKWTHVVGVYNSSDMLIYENEILIGNTSKTGNIAVNNSVGVYIGDNPVSLQREFDGFIDEVMIWNRSLSQNEINQLYYTNLQKYDIDKWSLYVNQTNILDGAYTYYGYAKDLAGNVNKTETRTLNIDTNNLFVNFVSPTDDNGAFVSVDSSYVNVSVSDAENPNNLTAFIDWNRSLVGWWRLYKGSGQWASDSSSWNNSGTLGATSSSGTDDPAWTFSGKFGKALEFDGINDSVYVQNHSSLDITSEITLEAWIKTKDITAQQQIVYRGNTSDDRQYGLDINSSGHVRFMYANAGGGVASNDLVGSSTALEANKFYHVAGVFDGTNMNIYLNGFLDRTHTSKFSPPPSNPNHLFYIGRIDNVNPSQWLFFNGTIDEVKVWSRALTPEEINASFNAGLHRLENNFTNLVEGDYEYVAYVQDLAGNLNQTETRTLTIDLTNPLVQFEIPTPPNNSIISDNSTEINISSTEFNLKEFTYNWNKTNYTFYNDSLVLMMNFDNVSSLGENDTYVKDLSNYGNDGVVGGLNFGFPSMRASFTPYGRYNGAYNFSVEGLFATSDRIVVPSSESLNLSTAMAVSAWIKFKDVPAVERVIVGAKTPASTASTWTLGTGSGANSGKILFNIFTNFDRKVYSTTTLVQDKWYHVVGSWDGSSVDVYIDGEKEGSAIRGGTMTGSYTPLFIGSNGDELASAGVNATIDELRIYNKSLSEGEARELYYSNLNKYDADKWNFYINQTNITTGIYTYYGYAKDLAGNVNKTETRIIRTNTPPTVTLDSPVNNFVSTNRTVFFNWTGFDADGDTLEYEFNITLHGAGICSDSRNIIPLTIENYTISPYLECLSDNSNYYNWTVRVSDDAGASWSAWATPRRLDIQGLISINLTVDSINFGSLLLGDSNDTVDNSPLPFLIENDGNAFVNISLNASDLWNTQANPTLYFMYKVDNVSGEEGSFNWTLSHTAWKKVPSPLGPEEVILKLNWSDVTDSAEVDLNVTVPGAAEGSGDRQSIMTFSATLDE